jgi:hypothetical protein
MEARHDIDIAGERGCAVEAGRVAGLGYDAGGQGADSPNCSEQLPDLVCSQPALYLEFELPSGAD